MGKLPIDKCFTMMHLKKEDNSNHLTTAPRARWQCSAIFVALVGWGHLGMVVLAPNNGTWFMILGYHGIIPKFC